MRAAARRGGRAVVVHTTAAVNGPSSPGRNVVVQADSTDEAQVARTFDEAGELEISSEVIGVWARGRPSRSAVAAQVVALSSSVISSRATGQVVTVAGGIEGRELDES